MWYLISLENPDNKYVLLGGKDYIVGRRDSDILVTGDPTVSRHHVELTVSHSEANLGNVNRLPVLKLKDISKFGTWVNKEKVSGERVLNDGDQIVFGSPKTSYTVVYEPLVISTSCLDSVAKKSIKVSMCILGGHIASEWQQDCSLLVMNKISVTIKVICALVALKPIVFPQYLEDYIKHLQGQAPKPEPESYLPVLAESQLDPSLASFSCNPIRKTLFQGMKFIFLQESQLKKMSLAIKLAGGMPVMLKAGENEHILVEDGAVVMAATPSEGVTKEYITKIENILKRHGQHVIPDSDVGYAVLYCSKDKHCNPNSQPEGNILKLPSQSLSQMQGVYENTSSQSGSRLRRKPDMKSTSDSELKGLTVCKQSASVKEETTVFEDLNKVKQEPTSQMSPVPRYEERKRNISSARAEAEETEPVEVFGKRIKMESVTPDHRQSSKASAKLVSARLDSESDQKLSGTSIRVKSSEVKSTKLTPDSEDDSDQYVEKSAFKKSAQENPLVYEPNRNLDTYSERTSSRTSGKTERNVVLVQKPTPESKVDVVFDDYSNQPSSSGGKKPVQKAAHDVLSKFHSDSRAGFDSDDDPVIDKDCSAQRKKEGAGIKDETKTMPQPQPQGNIDGVEQEAETKGSSSFLKRNREKDSSKRIDRGLVPPGFLSARFPPEDQRMIREEEVEEDLPSNCAQVDFVSLVKRQPVPIELTDEGCPKDYVRWKGKLVKNFKKFRKNGLGGTNSMPRIIGGRDLEIHVSANKKEIDDWFKEALEAESQHTADERRAQELFEWEPDQGRKRSR
ncbi:hypothetical protein CHS0354_038545 [Potamilus streckersoni]|uniref:Nibrin n=1 Tax=Potamilus streckersoni TaxID=2493646 RepID=A0AAE0VHH2_9BIVA|nr:hypothetical protein CHS0354_038545 [Potamilus streckersoni]